MICWAWGPKLDWPAKLDTEIPEEPNRHELSHFRLERLDPYGMQGPSLLANRDGDWINVERMTCYARVYATHVSVAQG